MAYATELDMDVRLLWLHAFVLWLEHEPVLDTESQEQIRAALKRLRISEGGAGSRGLPGSPPCGSAASLRGYGRGYGLGTGVTPSDPE